MNDGTSGKSEKHDFNKSISFEDDDPERHITCIEVTFLNTENAIG